MEYWGTSLESCMRFLEYMAFTFVVVLSTCFGFCVSVCVCLCVCVCVYVCAQTYACILNTQSLIDSNFQQFHKKIFAYQNNLFLFIPNVYLFLFQLEFGRKEKHVGLVNLAIFNPSHRYIFFFFFYRYIFLTV